MWKYKCSWGHISTAKKFIPERIPETHIFAVKAKEWGHSLQFSREPNYVSRLPNPSVLRQVTMLRGAQDIWFYFWSLAWGQVGKRVCKGERFSLWCSLYPLSSLDTTGYGVFGCNPQVMWGHALMWRRRVCAVWRSLDISFTQSHCTAHRQPREQWRM